MASPPNNEDLARYAAFWEAVSPADLGRLAEVFTEDVHFVDPFNDVTGLDRLRLVFEEMFENMVEPKFTVTGQAVGEDACFLRWRFTFRLRENGKERQIVGISEVRIAPDGRVAEHIDHWDAARQAYEEIPVLGAILRMLRRRFSID